MNPPLSPHPGPGISQLGLGRFPRAQARPQSPAPPASGRISGAELPGDLVPADPPTWDRPLPRGTRPAAPSPAALLQPQMVSLSWPTPGLCGHWEGTHPISTELVLGVSAGSRPHTAASCWEMERVPPAPWRVSPGGGQGSGWSEGRGLRKAWSWARSPPPPVSEAGLRGQEGAVGQGHASPQFQDPLGCSRPGPALHRPRPRWVCGSWARRRCLLRCQGLCAESPQLPPDGSGGCPRPPRAPRSALSKR